MLLRYSIFLEEGGKISTRELEKEPVFVVVVVAVEKLS